MNQITGRVSPARVPRVRGDRTLTFLAQGYAFGSRNFDRLGTDAFRTRLAGQRVLFLRGADAARFFYEGGRFTRTAALPPTVLHSLQDKGSVQTLSGAEHRARKALFLDVLEDRQRARMVQVFRDQWERALPSWQDATRVGLHDATAEVLVRTVCQWAGLPLREEDVRARTKEFLAMIDGAGAFGPRNWRGLLLRSRTERWARQLLADADADSDTIVGRLLRHRDLDGSRLEVKTAAVELLNLLRPTVAVGRFIVFAALALHRHPQWAARFGSGDEQHLRGFVQEVRRCTPFFPVVGGRAAEHLRWQGADLPAGSWTMLDIFATNRDGRLWRDPLLFRPERHSTRTSHLDALIAQGAGDYSGGHRCPGEPATVDLLEEAVRLLTRSMRYAVPEQDLRVRLDRFPTAPASGFVMAGVTAA